MCLVDHTECRAVGRLKARLWARATRPRIDRINGASAQLKARCPSVPSVCWMTVHSTIEGLAGRAHCRQVCACRGGSVYHGDGIDKPKGFLGRNIGRQ